VAHSSVVGPHDAGYGRSAFWDEAGVTENSGFVSVVASPIVSPILIGREAELATLRRALEAARAGAGGAVLVSGDAGIGKSRLVAELRARAQTLGCLVLQGVCFESDRALPYAALLDLLRTLVAHQPAEVVAAWLLPSARQLVRTVPELADWLPGVTPAPPLEPEAEKRRLFHSVGRLFVRIATDQPLVLVVEDLQWGDDASLELLASLARGVPTLPVLLLLTYRAEEAQPSLQRLLVGLERERLATDLVLSPLGLTEVDAMMRLILDLRRPVRAELLHLVYRLTEGNPFFVEEIVRLLPAAALMRGDLDAGVVARVPVPRTVQEAVQRHVDELDDAARGVLELAAVIGHRFDFGLLQDLASCGEDELVRHLKRLMAARLVIETSTEQFAFAHALTREAVYVRLLGRERRALHQRVACALVQRAGPVSDVYAAELAYHFHAGEEWTKTLEYTRRAGLRAVALHAPHAAIEQFSRGLDAARHQGMPPLSELLTLRGNAYAVLGDFPHAIEDYHTALEAARDAGDRRQEWQVLVALGMLWTWRDYARTGAYFRDALALARALGDPFMVAHSLNRIGNWHVNLDEPVEALRHQREALSIFNGLDSARGVAETLGLLAMTSYLGGDLLQGTSYCQRAIAAFRVLDDRQALSESLATLALGAATMFTDNLVPAHSLAEAVRAVEPSVSLAREIGWRAGEAFAQFNLAFCLGAGGDYGRALTAAQASLDIAQEIEHREWTTAALCVLGGLHLDLLALPAAREYLEQGLTQAQAIGTQHWIRHAAGLLASTLAEQRDLRRAEAVLALALGPDTPNESQGQRLVWCARAQLALAAAEPAVALQIIEKLAVSTPNASPERPNLRLDWLRGQALAALRRTSEAEAALIAASVAAETQGARPTLWRIQVALGRLFVVQRRRVAAAEAFASARGIVDVLAASLESDDPLRKAFLDAAGARLPRARPSSIRQASKAAFGGLTEREREVAALVAQARTNREIADALVLGERTVETHVENILAKLGLASRRDVGAWMVEHRLLPGAL
jgi:DNA-binding CsgD family transcriptional regulator/tetratricopeptide (TPR) repeat protein